MKKVVIGIIVVIIVLVITFIAVNILGDEKQENVKNDVNINAVINNSNNSNEEGDSSSDDGKITIQIEGEEEEIPTSRYNSSLGYTMKYESDNVEVSKEEGMDKYTVKDNKDVYYTVEFYPTSYEEEIASLQNKETISINGKEVTYVTKKEQTQLQEYYYFASDAGFFVISIYYPNKSEYLEGWANRIKAVVQTFEITE